jgi:hypothetical protein
VPQSLINPGADVSYKFYFGVPLCLVFLLVLDRVVFSLWFINNGVDFNTKLRDVVDRSSRKDFLAINEQVELFNGGFKLETGLKTKDTFRLECIRIWFLDVYA